MNSYNLTTQHVSTATPLQNAAPVAPSMAAHDSQPRDIQAAFAQGGLLVRTVTKANAHHELHHCDVTVDEAKQRHTDGATSHGGMRKWTLGHTDLRPNYYLLGGNTGFPRHMAFLALPEKVGEHVVGIHDTDASSGNPHDKRAMLPADARFGLNKMLGRLQANQQERPDQPLITNEVQTVGVKPEAIAGMLFQPSSKARSWEAARQDFQTAIDSGGEEFAGRSFPVFSYATDERSGKSELRLLDTLTRQG
ncbi:hypothetical protein ACIPL1_26445 [Pseudomonas sp. NPDC090202]|uniref:hypothetical protein n=1 Tax=unclassified Pseudomonas TaxID=196821 RepID=UPI0038118C15